MYVMVTTWKGHWDRIHNRQTSFVNGMIHLPSPTNGVETLFIKRDEARRVEKAWFGHIDAINRQTEKTHFEVHLDREAVRADWSEYENLDSGWHEVSAPAGGSTGVTHSADAPLRPPFFNTMATTTDFREFEDLCWKLLRVIGIHCAYRFPPEDQAGRADGFFKFGNLAVIYDATLSSNFEEGKRQQIQNYCNSLLTGTLEIAPMITENVASHQKQVWVITRGRTRNLWTLGGVGSVAVKEVAVGDLERIYVKRLVSPLLTEEALQNLLRNLGQP
ncbi:MAG: hypothetical protein ACKVU1_09050 [bacterium]